MTDETTTEQLAEIEGQATESTPATKYTPPEGWRVLDVGEVLRDGDVTVRADGYQYPTERVGSVVGAKQRYIRLIKPEPQAKPEPEPQAAAIEELRSEVSYVQRLLGESRQRVTQLEELVASLRTINEAQEKAFEAAGRQNDALRTQVRILQQEPDKKHSRIDFLETLNAGNGAAIGYYKAKVEKLQGLVDRARGQLETAATEHDSLSTQLAAVKAELVTQAETSRRLRIELDAAQQVPQAVSDRFEEGWDSGTARAVETIAEWTEPFRRCGSERLAWMVMANLPHIMRTLTGLTPED